MVIICYQAHVESHHQASGLLPSIPVFRSLRDQHRPNLVITGFQQSQATYSMEFVRVEECFGFYLPWKDSELGRVGCGTGGKFHAILLNCAFLSLTRILPK